MNEIYFYRSRTNRRQILQVNNNRGFRILHDDFTDARGIATDGSRGRLTLTNDPPIENPKDILLQLLLGKLENNTITFEQLKTLIRLEHGFELTQTTRDKILIAVQGVIGTLRDRLKSVFGL